MKTLLEGLRTLDPTNDAHWTAEGLPRLAVLEELTGKNVTRQDVNATAPGLTRNTNALPPDEATPAAGGEDPITVFAQQIAALDTQINALLRERRTLTAKIDALSAERNQLQRRLDALRPRVDENQRAISGFLASQKEQMAARGERRREREAHQRADPRAPIDQAFANRRRGARPIPAPRS